MAFKPKLKKESYGHRRDARHGEHPSQIRIVLQICISIGSFLSHTKHQYNNAAATMEAAVCAVHEQDGSKKNEGELKRTYPAVSE